MTEIERLRQWVSDLQAGCYINCVYCGHRYGPDPGTPVAMADVLHAHVAECPEHPLAAAKARLAELDSLLDLWRRIPEAERTAILKGYRMSATFARSLNMPPNADFIDAFAALLEAAS